jgi:hypothetical protein
MTITQKSARLILNTSLFYPNSTGLITGVGDMDTRMGYADAGRLNCTFTNLDWQMILGDLYNEYSTFSFGIESLDYLSNGDMAFASPNYIINVSATGLNWVDQTYDVLTRTKGSKAVIYSGTLNGSNSFNNNINGLIFARPAAQFSDFTLTITNATTGTQAGTYDRPCALVYVIKIFGVESSTAHNNKQVTFQTL